MFIDTHCHLDFNVFDDNRHNILDKCNNLQIKHFINPATKSVTWNKLIKLNQKFNNIHICFGMHPIFIDFHKKTELDKLEQYTQKIKTKLIGEIGLDKRISDFKKQLELFTSQVCIAKNLDKKIIIHCVKSHNEIIKIIKDNNFKNGGIIHAFNSNVDIAKTYIDLGFKIGVGGIISHPKSKLIETLKNIKPKDIVLETDSPDMKLYRSNDDINTPESIPMIFKLVNDIYKINTDILRQQIYNTSLEFI